MPNHKRTSRPADAGRPTASLEAPDRLQWLRASVDHALAPDVDYELIGALVRRELSEATARLVYRLIYTFDSWNQAHAQCVLDEYHRNPRDASPNST